MDSQTIVGGTIGPGATFGDGNVFENVTIIAPSTFGAGNSFINVEFKCQTGCKSGPCGCCSDVIKVGEGSSVVDSRGDHVEFEPTGSTTAFVDTGCTKLVLPDCNDCESRTIAELDTPVNTTGTEVVVSNMGTLTYEEWCKACDRSDALWDKDKVTVAPPKPPSST